MWRWASLAFALLLLLGPAAAEPAGQFQNAAVYIDAVFYEGAPFYRTEEGNWYVPLADVSARAGLGEPVLEDGFIDWQGFWMDSENEDFFFKDDTLYAKSDLLSDAGLKIQEGMLMGAKCLWIDRASVLDNSWADNTTLIAHAMGAVEGASYTNCLEAFYENYANGFSVFEIDLQMSADGIPVLVHEWQQFAAYVGAEQEEFRIPTLAEFKEMRILGEYTPLSFEDLAKLMVRHPDIRIVTDMKSIDPDYVRAMFAALLAIAGEVDPEILSRIIPQVYSNEVLDAVLEMYPWKSVVYTLYALPYTTTRTEAFRYGYERGVRVFTAPVAAMGTEFESLIRLSGCRLFLHTINDWDYYRQMKAAGRIWGVYTDSLTPLAMDGVESWSDE